MGLLLSPVQLSHLAWSQLLGVGARWGQQYTQCFADPADWRWQVGSEDITYSTWLEVSSKQQCCASSAALQSKRLLHGPVSSKLDLRGGWLFFFFGKIVIRFYKLISHNFHLMSFLLYFCCSSVWTTEIAHHPAVVQSAEQNPLKQSTIPLLFKKGCFKTKAPRCGHTPTKIFSILGCSCVI